MAHNNPLTIRPPYPVDDKDAAAQEPYSPSLLKSPAFDLTDLEDAQAKKMSRGPSVESDATTKVPVMPLPDILRIGAGSGSGEGARKSGEARRSYEKGDIPESLKPGGARAGPVEKTEVYMHGALGETQETKMHGALGGAPETKMHGALPETEVHGVSGGERLEDVWGGEKLPQEPETPKSDASSPPPQMSANLSASDRPFSEYSPFYHPPNPPTAFTSSTTSTQSPSPKRPGAMAANSSNSDIRARQHSIASSISSVGFEPGADLSSFDASTTRALPGRRGFPAVGMDGWKEDEAEDDVAKTWEEELDRRAKAGAELQRRTEQAQEREREERLQAEFWEEEHRLAKGGPQTSGESSIQQPPTSRPVPAPPVEAMAQMNIRPPPPPPPSANTTTEIYQIKHITWTDPTTPGAPLRRSPILLQNANGPCPLLALVNALILSTPAGTKTFLREHLKLREQVSLELLLDAVFQELMDRGGLPDVSDLFAFLLTLHTGMNVNPRFIPTDHPLYGGFESTREMALYGSFKIPLVHGWLPEPNHPVIAALNRRGIASYEDAQTLLFTEEEIISRVTTSNATLNGSEEQLIEDASIIREFLDRNPTQLTAYGLDVLRKNLKRGDVAILFRNDHFMTVIGGRDDGALMGLVTDMGFAGHQEYVWERMVDVQGNSNEFLSGDFRPVGNNQPTPKPRKQEVRSLLDPNEGWETVPSAAGWETTPSSSGPPGQIDHDADLALAMQLQEEEDERARRNQERERRERPPPMPPRTTPGSGAGVATHRPADPAEHVPPPPYERVPTRASAGAPVLSAYQQQQQSWAQQQRRASLGAVGGGAVGSGPARRAEQARALMTEIATGAGTGASSRRRGSLGQQGQQGQQGQGQQGQGQQGQQGEDGKEKCVIC